MSGYQIGNHAYEARHLDAGLYIVATPIGNLGDITIRALDVLAGCDLIACEDTRVTGKLLRHYAIRTKTVSYHEHNAVVSGPKLIGSLNNGKAVALVTDAGMPLVSDPGFRLVEQARAKGIPVWPLPGATAPVAALVASGLPAETWMFAGFLPTKQMARKTRLEKLSGMPATLIFFESPNRLEKSLADMVCAFGEDRQAAVARELTKLHEEVTGGRLAELVEKFSGRKIRGEIVIVVAPPETGKKTPDVDKLLGELLETLSVSKAATEAAALTGLSKRDLYQKALELKDRP